MAGAPLAPCQAAPRFANAWSFLESLESSCRHPGTKREETDGSRAARRGGPLWHFLKGFIKHPVMVGSIIPSSKAVIDKMLGPVDWANCKLFVEYGPGVGTFTEHVLRRMAPDATLIAIDTNEDFIRYLAGKFRDNRLLAVNGSAADVGQIIADCGFEHADYILSGLPFSTLPRRRRPADRRGDL